MIKTFKKISPSTIILFIICLIFSCLSLFTVIYFSVQINNDIQTIKQYSKYDSNITSYDIIKSGNQYHGFINIQSLYSTNNCSLFIISEQTYIKVESYLQFYYTLYSIQFFYYTENNCYLNFTNNLNGDIGMVIGFFIITIICIGSLYISSLLIRTEIKRIREDNDIIEMISVKTSL